MKMKKFVIAPKKVVIAKINVIDVKEKALQKSVLDIISELK